MKYIVILFIGLILGACSVSEDPDMEPSTDVERRLQELLVEADRIMSLPTSSPEGRLKMVKNSISTSDIYYPTDESFSYSVLKDANLDTVGIILSHFNDEQVKTRHSISFENGEAYRWSTYEYVYTSESLLDEIYSSNSNMQRRLLGKYHYDSQNLLIKIEYPYETGVELQLYEYDEFNRIAREWKTAKGQENHKIDYLVYRYDEELLAAKESGTNGSISDEREDAFQYFYDSQGKLIMAKEFDPYLGFQQKEKLEYFYYGEDN